MPDVAGFQREGSGEETRWTTDDDGKRRTGYTGSGGRWSSQISFAQPFPELLPALGRQPWGVSLIRAWGIAFRSPVAGISAVITKLLTLIGRQTLPMFLNLAAQLLALVRRKRSPLFFHPLALLLANLGR